MLQDTYLFRISGQPRKAKSSAQLDGRTPNKNVPFGNEKYFLRDTMGGFDSKTLNLKLTCISLETIDFLHISSTFLDLNNLG